LGNGYLLGIDLGSSSVKVALVDAQTQKVLALAHAPDTEMDITAPQIGWAEQDPELWWTYVLEAIRKLFKNNHLDATQVRAIGISYQMHGLVTLDAEGKVVRPAIIWCDSRAVAIGHEATDALSADYCMERYLNGPGNFTASKLRWVQQNEPALYERIRWAMLPGDYIAYRFTGEIGTTISGLSEGILWDFHAHTLARGLLSHYGIDAALFPPILPTFGLQGRVQAAIATELGIPVGTPVTYRAGDQPNNALSLNALKPGEVAATGGTSGVIYGVVDTPVGDPLQRVNSFAHVNYQQAAPRIGVLLCINGAGIQHRWMRQFFASQSITYAEMEAKAAQIAIGSEGLRILPFGNGAERMLGNRDVGAQYLGIQFNRHQAPHFYRAGLEGISFSFVYGAQVMQTLGLDVSVLRAGNDNLFQSAIFAQTIANLLHCRIEVLRSTGAAGAALAAGVGIGLWKDPSEAMGMLELVQVFEPQDKTEHYQEAYLDWVTHLRKML
jgi:xylulokinase